MKTNYTPTSNQHTILLLAHKFRFITSMHLSAHKKVNRSASQRTLETLRKNNYLNRHYNNSYKLLGKSARYYLSKRGIKYLKDTDVALDPDLDQDDKEDKMLIFNLHYKNKNMGQAYIDHCIDTYSLYLKLSKDYPSHLIFSRIELARDEDYIDPKPDLFLEATDEAQGHIFVDLFASTQTWVIKKRVDQYIEQCEDGLWEGDYPEVRIYSDNQRQAESIQNYADQRIEDEFIEGFGINLVLATVRPHQDN